MITATLGAASLFAVLEGLDLDRPWAFKLWLIACANQPDEFYQNVNKWEF